MKESIIEYLGCPKCNSDLDLKKNSICTITRHIIDGELTCTGCKTVYLIIKGVPFFDLNISDSDVDRNIKNFADEWNYFTSKIDEKLTRGELESYFYSFVQYKDLDNKIILDAGCGGGRFSYIISRLTNAKEIIGVDLSNAVFTAFDNTKHLGNVTIIQADIRKMPFKKKKLFDFILSVGVIHHMPDPYMGFEYLIQHLNENAKILAWVYGKEGNSIYISIADPIRKVLTSRLPFKYNLCLSFILSSILWGTIWIFYFPANVILGEEIASRILPMNKYLNFFRKRGFKDFWRTVFDKMIPTIAHYISNQEIKNWFASSNLQYEVYFRNGHSWLGFGQTNSKVLTTTEKHHIKSANSVSFLPN